MRYIILVLLNLPVILLALLNLITKYKLKRIGVERFRIQMTTWIIILLALIASFPIYNYLVGNPPLSSVELSVFDIVQTTVIILLFYIVNNQRQKIETIDQRLRDFHQELSIILSSDKHATIKDKKH